MMHVSQIIMLCTLNLYFAAYLLYLNKTEIYIYIYIFFFFLSSSVQKRREIGPSVGPHLHKSDTHVKTQSPQERDLRVGRYQLTHFFSVSREELQLGLFEQVS